MKRFVLVFAAVALAAAIWLLARDERDVMVAGAPPTASADGVAGGDPAAPLEGERAEADPRPGQSVAPGSAAVPGEATGGAAEAGEPAPAPGDAGAPADSTATAILERTARRYQSIRSLRADFVLEADNPLLRRTITSRGTLAQKRPGRLLLDFSDPEGDVIVSDGTHIWVYYPSADPRQVIRTSGGDGGAGGIDLQAQFIGDPVRRFEHTLEGRESVAGRPADVLSLKPHGDAGYRELRIWVDRGDGLIRRFQITELNGAVRRFDLSALEVNVPLDDALFRFTPPANARIVER